MSTPAHVDPHPKWEVLPDADHFVQFYDSDAFLVDSVCGYVAAGLVSGDPALVIATEPHRTAIETELHARGLDVAAARAQGRYLSLDAADVLRQFAVDGVIDADRFAAVVGKVLTQLARSRRRTRAFGEMVAILWSRGDQAAAVRLEQLWNELAKAHSFSLFCAYPMHDFAEHTHGQPFHHICCTHSRVLPAESYTSLPDREDRLRAVAELQQKARSLDAEIDRRNAAQRSLAARELELADFFDNASEGIHKVGRDGTILWANRAELQLLGYTAKEYIGRHIAEFHADRDVIDGMLARLRCGEALFNQPARLRCKDGSIKHVLVQSNACFENGQFAYTRCFTRDVTDRIRAEEELRAAKAAAEEACLAKDELLAGVSSKLRTALDPVLSSVDALGADPAFPAHLRDELATIRGRLAAGFIGELPGAKVAAKKRSSR